MDKKSSAPNQKVGAIIFKLSASVFDILSINAPFVPTFANSNRRIRDSVNPTAVLLHSQRALDVVHLLAALHCSPQLCRLFADVGVVVVAAQLQLGSFGDAASAEGKEGRRAGLFQDGKMTSANAAVAAFGLKLNFGWIFTKFSNASKTQAS